MSQDFIVGTFVREEKNRFLCTVTVDGIDEECYIPSSCRIENFLKLAGKEVLLKENQNKNGRTRLAVYAIKFKQNYMILRTSEANDIIWNAIKGRRFSYLGNRNVIQKECIIDGYKADIYLPQTRTVIEIKSIINTGKEALFPTVYSARANEQLFKIKQLLNSGYNFTYIFVSLNPYVRHVMISNQEAFSEFKKLFMECINLGMKYKAYTSKLMDAKPIIFKEIDIIVS